MSARFMELIVSFICDGKEYWFHLCEMVSSDELENIFAERILNMDLSKLGNAMDRKIYTPVEVRIS